MEAYTAHFFFYHGATVPSGLGPPHIEPSLSHSDTPHSVGLLWTSDQSVAETPAWQYTTLTRERHSFPRWDSNLQSQQASSLTSTP